MAEIAKIKGYDIRDKKLVDATSQSTVAATDAIEMKTTSGDQVYITRDSFVQAMASVLNSNSQSTISQLFGADANGNHAAINLKNLASALPAMKEGSEYRGDLNADFQSGCYELVPSENNHSPVGTRAVLLNFRSSIEYYHLQIVATTTALYVRMAIHISTWGSWHTIYS